MVLKHLTSKNEADSSVELALYGAIGQKVDGDYFAQEINYLAKEYDEIHIRVNSEGGSVLQGLSIFNAIMNAPAFTIVTIEGVAASMAGVIAMAADLVRMNDFARLMVHDPMLAGRRNLSKKESKALNSIKDMLTTLLSRRGVESEKMASFMADETWFTAEEAKELKLVDEIVDTGKAKQVKNVLSDIAAQHTPAAYIEFLNVTLNNSQDMKQISLLLGLTDSATEVEILAAITKLQNKEAALKLLADGLKAEKATAQEAEAKALVSQAIKDGHYKEEQRENLTKMATDSFETFKLMVSSLEKPAAPAEGTLSGTIKAESVITPGEEKKDFEWYRRNDAEALAEMQRDDKPRFDKLYAAWNTDDKA